MNLTSKERFIRTCLFENLDRPPVWMMRQAGRTLSEYRALREKYSFGELCKTPELAAQVTLQPLNRFPVDAAIIFSDILVIPDAMGMTVEYSPALALSPPIRDITDINRLSLSNIEKKLDYVSRIIRLVSSELGEEKAILGFSGAPYTLACYMIEGGSSKHFLKVRELMYHNPQSFKQLMDKLTKAVTDYLRMQMENSITAVQLFDTWAGELNPQDYRTFVLPAVQKIIQDLKKEGIPIIYYINGIGNLLEIVGETGADIIGIDWRLTLSNARERLGKEIVLQGNLDPSLLFATNEIISQRVIDMLAMTEGKGHIVNLGHGLLPETPVKGIETFIKTVTNWSAPKENM